MFSRRMATALLALVALSGMALAHEERDDRNRDVRRYGLERGYRDGDEHGRQDRFRRAGYDYRNHDYKQADRGYRSSMGSKGQYKKAYRQGYERGYDDAYRGRRAGSIWGRDRDRDYPVGGDPRRDDDGWGRDDDWWRDSDYGHDGRHDNLWEQATQAGYRDGVYAGRNDRNRNERFDYDDEKAFKNADNGYYKALGDKDDYKRVYRQNFRRGYEEGYRGWVAGR